MFYEGEGTKVDYDEAFGWFGKAAEQGHADAMFQMANMLAQGHGFPQSIYASLYWLQKSAAAGNETAAEFFPSMCSTMAAKAYSKGDPAYALKLSLLLAELGDAEAQYRCGMLCFAMEADDKARYWLEKAAAQGLKEAQDFLRKER